MAIPGKTFSQLTNTATREDFVASNYGAIETPEGFKKVPANLFDGGTSTIYPSLQDAIEDEANLSVGDVFDTNGFYSSGDGGAARYQVSDSGVANGKNIVELSAGKNAVLQVHAFIHPECYGAKGDNSTDNTAVFDAIFSDANVKSIMLSANKTYKIQFKNWTLRNITLVGADKMSSRLSQMNTNLNKPFATIGIGVEIGNICFICGGGNTQQTGLFHFGNDENGTFQPFIGSIIHDIYAYCVQNIIGFDFSYTQSGSHTIRIEHCKLDAPGIGVRVTNLNDLTHQSYLSNFYFNDIIVTGPYNYGFSFDKSQAGGMMISHGSLTQCSVQLSRNGSCGYKLSYGDYSILNPCVFVENTSGEVFSVELDLDKLYVPVVPNGILNVIGGILEGTIKNKEFLHSINWYGVDFVEEQNFPEGNSGHRAYSRHLNTTPNSIFTKSFSEVKTGITLTNATSSEDSGDYGKTIKLAVTDFEESQVTIKIPIDLPNVEKLTSVFLFELSNGYKFLTSGSLPSVALTNSSNESILDALGPDPKGKRNRITMDDLEKYYALVGTFDISETDRTKTWYLQVNIPTNFSTANENAFVSILGVNLYEDYVKLADVCVNKVNSPYWLL